MPEIQAIEAELRARLGDSGRTSPSYIANVLREAGTLVEIPEGFTSRYVDPAMDEPYASRLKGLLQFGDLETAEDSLRKLDAAYQEYTAASDRVGTKLVRSLALKGKLRAESLASNPRVSTEKQKEKKEIANWFRVWLGSPALFLDWLELRKGSQEFQREFRGADEERRTC